MNVLILTPDAVGSTLLQRTITVYMQLHEYDRPVINLHELTNGLVRYHSDDFNQPVLGKDFDSIGYYQSLDEIVSLLGSVDHYKTSRLAHYHLRRRNDSPEQTVPFYRYLNDNFYIVACFRKNVFEHALSWSLNKITSKLNVYGHKEKVDTFVDLFDTKVNIDVNSFEKSLDDYKSYVSWVEQYFDVASYFYYDEHVKDIENFVLDLPVFAGKDKKTFEQVFGISFNHWNMCHYLGSNIGTLAIESPEKFKKLKQSHQNLDLSESVLLQDYRSIAGNDWPAVNSIEDIKNLPQEIINESKHLHNIDLMEQVKDKQSFVAMIHADDRKFLSENLTQYNQVNNSINQMHKIGILPGTLPIKKQTLKEKQYMVKNFNQCIDVYNNWVNNNPGFSDKISTEQLDKSANNETTHWQQHRKLITKT